MKLAYILAIVVTTVIFTLSAPSAQAIEGERLIESRVIKIEGSVEKPRVIFIVPKARLWRAHITDKDFTEELLRPIRPDR